MLISNIVMDFEVAKKRKKTRRGKRCGRKVREGSSGQNCKENNGNFQLFQNNEYQYDCTANIAASANESGMDHLMNKIIRDKAAEVSNQSRQRTSRYFKKSTNFIRPSSPKAPHNSTQYLMEEHEDNQTFQFTGDQSLYSPNRQADYNYKVSVSPSDEVICDAVNNNDQNFDLCQSFEMDCSFSDVDSVAFMMNEFDQMYDSIRAEQLSGLSKPELINAVKNLENEVTMKERRLFSSPVKSRSCTPKKSKSSIKSDMMELLSELDKLKHENIQMKKQIDELQLIL